MIALAILLGSAIGLAAGIAMGRSDVRREQRRSTVILLPHRVFEPWSKGKRKN